MVLIFPGTFDPPTLGHMDLIERSAALGEKLIVSVLYNPRKKTSYSLEMRIEMLSKMVAHLPNVEVDYSEGLLIDYAAKVGASAVVRGLRNSLDYQYEKDMADANAYLGGLETIFLQSNPAHTMISSSVVREVLQFGGDITGLVPACILELLQKK